MDWPSKRPSEHESGRNDDRPFLVWERKYFDNVHFCGLYVWVIIEPFSSWNTPLQEMSSFVKVFLAMLFTSPAKAQKILKERGQCAYSYKIIYIKAIPSHWFTPRFVWKTFCTIRSVLSKIATYASFDIWRTTDTSIIEKQYLTDPPAWTTSGTYQWLLDWKRAEVD